MMKINLTAEQAIGLLPDGNEIHTFKNGGFGLMGADWKRDKLTDYISKCEVREMTGERAMAMKLGLAVYPKTARYQSDILFIETDMDKLATLETSLAKL